MSFILVKWAFQEEHHNVFTCLSCRVAVVEQVLPEVFICLSRGDAVIEEALPEARGNQWEIKRKGEE